mmetsp:Transcript_99997/g.288706  ORF Transcript_99997/g.288706 Transcript_99997/m.288706 type:complete len:320 (-) Transcript_99997:21-980(-)
MRAQPVGQEHRIRVDLHSPLVLFVLALRLHLPPDIDEDVRVHHRLPIALADAPPLEDVRSLALEDADLVRAHHGQQRLLVPGLHPRSDDPLGRDHRKAVERRAGGVARLLDDVRAHVPAEHVASPCLAVAGGELFTSLAATCPLVVLLEALEARAPAAARLEAVLALPRADRGRSLAQGLARPSASCAIAVRRALGARLVATRPVLVLPVALRARPAAALRGAAIVTIGRAIPRRPPTVGERHDVLPGSAKDAAPARLRPETDGDNCAEGQRGENGEAARREPRCRRRGGALRRRLGVHGEREEQLGLRHDASRSNAGT